MGMVSEIVCFFVISGGDESSRGFLGEYFVFEYVCDVWIFKIVF